MARHILTFFVIFVAISFAMRGCTPKADAPAEPRTVTIGELDDAVLLNLKTKDGKTVVLDRNGTLVEVRIDEKMEYVSRTAPTFSRAFHLLFVDEDGRKSSLGAGDWKREKIENGFRFTYDKDELKVVKTITLSDDGSGLDFALEINGASKSTPRVWMTAASGVPLGRADALSSSGSVWQIDDGKLVLRGYERMLETREQERKTRIRKMRAEDDKIPVRRPYAERRELPAGAQMTRCGIAGTQWALTLAAAQGTEVSQLFADVYRAERRGGVTNEVETWIDFNLREQAFEGQFAMRWQPVAALKLGGKQAPSKQATLENDTMRVVFTDRGAAVRELWLKKFTERAGEPLDEENWVPVLRSSVRPGQRALTLLGDEDRFGVDTARATWTAVRSATEIVYTLKTPTGWTLTKSIKLPKEDSFDLAVAIEIKAPDSSSARRAEFQLVGPAGAYIEDAYRGIIGADPPAGVLIERSGGDNEDMPIESFAEGEELQANYGGSREGLLTAVAVRGSYFVCALAPAMRQDSGGSLRGSVTGAVLRLIKLEEPVTRADGETSSQNIMGVVSCSAPIQSGTARETFTLYAGPNRLDDLRPIGLEETIDYGVFGFIGRGLMWLMKALESLFGSYGIAIMFMTLIVRALLFPVSYRTQLGMQRYAKRLNKIKPILEELDKKYGKNPQKLNQEKMKTMREHGVGLPLGCLTMFIQIPIWFALFQALRVEFAIRHQPFLWANDLSMPDHLFGLPFFPGEFNLFPLLMLVLWVTQQKLAPQTGSKSDPQVQMQMKMMKFMPFMFFIFLYKYIAALSIYMCVSSAWSIVESKLVKKAIARMD